MVAAKIPPHQRFPEYKKLTTLSVEQIMTNWRPGSHDTADGPEGANLEWTWKHEAADLFIRESDGMAKLIQHVMDHGISFADFTNPIMLGYDGRAWDGHHRLVVARALGIVVVDAEVVPDRLGELGLRMAANAES